MSRSVFKCIDSHTCGNPVRVVTSNQPELAGATMSEKRQHFLQEFDWIRTGLMFEPRGHDAMSGSILYDPVEPDGDLGVLFIEVSGCLPMCGHGAIGTVTVALEEGLVTPASPGLLKLDTPAGRVEARYAMNDGYVDSVQLTNIPSFLHSSGITVGIAGLGNICVDVSYGGNFYAIVDPQKNFSGVHDFTAGKIIQYSQIMRDRINNTYPDMFIHPENETIRDVTHLLWTGDPIDSTSSGRNAVFYGEKAIDRSPCGTGTSAIMAQLYSKGKLKKGESFIHESYIGSKFIGCVEDVSTIDGNVAIIPSIQGWAKIYGYNTIIIDDEDDPYAHGF